MRSPSIGSTFDEESFDSVFRTAQKTIQRSHKRIDDAWRTKFNQKVTELNEALQRAVDETKKKKWCHNCLKEVMFDGGFNPTACRYSCWMELMYENETEFFKPIYD